MAITRDRYKLVYYVGYGVDADGYELYDVESDPEELDDLYASHPSVAVELTQELQSRIEQANRQYVT